MFHWLDDGKFNWMDVMVIETALILSIIIAFAFWFGYAIPNLHEMGYR